MRISGTSNVDGATLSKSTTSAPKVDNVVTQQVSNAGQSSIQPTKVEEIESTQLDKSKETKALLQEAVSTMNEVLEANNNTSRFKYHEGLDRYYVTVVDKNTDEVVKEIPAKKLLDAFYEMQRMVGMIVDEKI